MRSPGKGHLLGPDQKDGHDASGESFQGDAPLLPTRRRSASCSTCAPTCSKKAPPQAIADTVRKVIQEGEPGGRELDLLIHRAQIEIIALNPEQVELARSIWRDYGKGRHPAGLNIGNCCSYALAKHAQEPLLFKGDDFAKTDIPAVKTSRS